MNAVFAGKALVALKDSFGNAATELLGWGPLSGDTEKDGYVHCTWTGVLCDNLTSSVVSL